MSMPRLKGDRYLLMVPFEEIKKVKLRDGTELTSFKRIERSFEGYVELFYSPSQWSMVVRDEDVICVFRESALVREAQ